MFFSSRGKKSLMSVVVLLCLTLVFCGCSSDPATTGISSGSTTTSPNNTSTSSNANTNGTTGSISNSGTSSTTPGETMVDLNGNEIVSNSSTGQGVSLNVPIRNQLDPANGALGEVACGPTCLAMALQFAGINVPTPTLMIACNLNPKDGCLQEDMLAAGKIYSPNTQIFSGKDTNWVKEQLNAGKPVIITVPGHYMVCIGYDAQGNFLFNDPYGGKKLTLSPAEFANQFEGDAVMV